MHQPMQSFRFRQVEAGAGAGEEAAKENCLGATPESAPKGGTFVRKKTDELNELNEFFMINLVYHPLE